MLSRLKKIYNKVQTLFNTTIKGWSCRAKNSPSSDYSTVTLTKMDIALHILIITPIYIILCEQMFTPIISGLYTVVFHFKAAHFKAGFQGNRRNLSSQNFPLFLLRWKIEGFIFLKISRLFFKKKDRKFDRRLVENDRKSIALHLTHHGARGLVRTSLAVFRF